MNLQQIAHTGRHRNRHDRERHSRGGKLGYRPALDGIRAIAVIAVMLYHGGASWISGGFLGVDVFFVLSGFLITSLLAQEWSGSGRIDLRAFWLRRARRLIPAMLLVIVAVVGYFSLATAGPQPLLRGDALATFGYVSNWWFVITGESYFEQFLQPSPLRHTWSLAIEEQFYILFPLLMVLLLGRARLSMLQLRRVLLGGAVACALWMAWLYEPLTDPSRVYYGTDTRAQALLLGAALALAPVLARPAVPLYTRVGTRVVALPGWGALGWLSLGGLLAMFVAARELAPWMYQGGFLLAAAMSAVLIAAVSLAPHSSLGRLLSLRPVVAIGKVSYGLYLWHWPVFVALNREFTGLHGTALLALRVAVTAALAGMSYYLVEEPIRTQRLQRRFTRTRWARTVAVSMAGVVALIVGVTSTVAVQGTALSGGASEPTAEATPDAQGRLVRAFVLGDSQSFSVRSHYTNSVPGLAVSGSTQLGCGTLLPERHVDGQTVSQPARVR